VAGSGRDESEEERLDRNFADLTAGQERLYLMGNRLALAGLAFLAIAMTGAIGLVVDVVFSRSTAVVSSLLTGGLFAFLWGVMPAGRVLRRRD